MNLVCVVFKVDNDDLSLFTLVASSCNILVGIHQMDGHASQLIRSFNYIIMVGP